MSVRRNYISTYLHTFSCQESDQQQQRGVHDADHGHGGQPPVPRHAEALHLQGPRLHHGLLDIIQTELGGAQTYTRAYQRGICTIYILILIYDIGRKMLLFNFVIVPYCCQQNTRALAH